MKVLDVTEFYSERGGGVRSHLALKSQVLCRLGHEHVVVAPGVRDSDDDVTNVGADVARPTGRARVVRIAGPASPYDPTYHLLARFHQVASIVSRERPDVLEIHSPYLAALGALRANRKHYGVRTFQWHSDFIDTYAGVLEGQLVHSLPGVAWAPLLQSASQPLWHLVRAIARRSHATLVASEWQVAKLRAHGVENVVHVPFGLERELFHEQTRSEETRHELLALTRAAAPGTLLLVGVGRFAIEKRWDVVIDAFLRARALLPTRPMALILFGDGPERARMLARIGSASGIAMPGFIKDRNALARMLASADVLVHGCPFETFGLSIAEAMRCGLPTVVPDAGGASEMHVEGAGERYRALDVEACANAIVRLAGRLDTDAPSLRNTAVRASARLPSVTEQFAHQITLYETWLRS